MDKDKAPSKNDLGLSMIETLRSDLSGVTKDLAEVGLDALLKDGVFKDVPVIGTITGLAKTAIAIRDKILARKIYSFLIELRDISIDERRNFLDEMEGDSGYQRKVGENLIMLIDRLDDLDKSTLTAKVFKAYIRKDINYQQFLRFASVIDRMLVKDLQNLLEAISSQHSSTTNNYAEYLYPFGLSNLSFDDDMFVKAGSGTKEIRHSQKAKFFPSQNPLQFKLSTMAYLLAQILLDKKIGFTDYVAQNRRELEK